MKFDEEPTPVRVPTESLNEQVRQRVPQAFAESSPDTCGACRHLVDRGGKTFCNLRRFNVKESEMACDHFEKVRR